MGTPTISSAEEMKALVSHALETALKLGASSAAAEVSDEKGRCVTVRNFDTESIEYTRDRSFSICVYIGKSRASASSGDLSPKSIENTIRAAVDMARYTAEDKDAGLPPADRLCLKPRNLNLCHPWDISVEEMTDIAVRAERAGRDYSPQIVNSDGAGINSSVGSFVLGNTEGFLAGYPFSNHSIDVSLVARDKNGMQNGSWYSLGTSPHDLLSPEEMGQIAARRAVSALSPRSLKTQKCPVIFEAPAARSLFRCFTRAVSGAMLYRDMSFLKNALDTKVFSDKLTIVENPFVPGAYGSAPFDDEGVLPSERLIVDQGILRGLFLSTYTARKLGVETTGNAGGPFNLFFRNRDEASEPTLVSLLHRMDRGLLITETMGQGINLTTGDYSQGASGFWVENGEICYPVENITVAGNLRDMFLGFDAMAEDYDLNGVVRCGSTLLAEMTVAGS